MRINLYGGPCAGKSTTAAWLFSELKGLHYSVELVGEYVKNWAYQNRRVNYFDQIYLFGKQMQYEYGFLSHGVDHIVTDSPVFLSYCYSKKYLSSKVAHPLKELAAHYDEEHPCVNIFLDRSGKPYKQEGRYQTEEEAKALDEFIWQELLSHYGSDKVNIFHYQDRRGILDKVINKLQENG